MITGYELFLIGGGNPADFLAHLFQGEVVCPRPWAAKFLWNRHHGENTMGRGNVHTCECVMSLNEGEIERWAIAESLNFGSHQRATLPRNVAPFLIGSGRWLATDTGGWDRLLLSSTLEWIDLDHGVKAAYNRAAEHISHRRPPHGMCVKGQADWIDRGKLIDAVVESIFAVWEIHPGTIRFDIGINRADVKIGDQVPEWIAKYYEEADESDSDRIDRALGQCDEHIPGGLVLACAAPWEEQDQAEKEDRDCERCLWRKASRLVTFEDFRKHQLGSPAA